jgi:hypothetical protein
MVPLLILAFHRVRATGGPRMRSPANDLRIKDLPDEVELSAS